jgi:hypothetical protein
MAALRLVQGSFLSIRQLMEGISGSQWNSEQAQWQELQPLASACFLSLQ